MLVELVEHAVVEAGRVLVELVEHAAQHTLAVETAIGALVERTLDCTGLQAGPVDAKVIVVEVAVGAYRQV